MSKSRTGLADSPRRWTTRSAMDDAGVPCLHLTLLAIDLDERIMVFFRIGVGSCFRGDTVDDSTIKRDGNVVSNGISSLPPALNCTFEGASDCTLGGAAICTLGGASVCTLGVVSNCTLGA